jgi:hypothetical protein
MKRDGSGSSAFLAKVSDLLSLLAIRQLAAKYPAKEKSMQDALPDGPGYQEIIDKKSPDGLLFFIIIFSFGLILLADDTHNRGLKGFVNSVLDLIHLIFSDQPRPLLVREFFVPPGFVDLLHFDDPAHCRIDRHDQLPDLLLRCRLET